MKLPNASTLLHFRQAFYHVMGPVGPWTHHKEKHTIRFDVVQLLCAKTNLIKYIYVCAEGNDWDKIG